MDAYIRGKEKYDPLSELPNNNFSLDSIYRQIQDIYHPTIQDYRFIQNFLWNGERKNLERLRDMEPRMRSLKIIGDTPEEFPQSGSVHVNRNINDRENCILIYATYNLAYQRGLKRLLKLIMESDYKGHVLYRAGGWPDAEGGSLVLSHVPYAFKVSFFKEAERKGFKRVLWLDTSVVPVASLNTIFDMIKEKGYFAMENTRMVGPHMCPEAAVYFGLNLQQTFHIRSCSAGLFGVDFTNPKAHAVLDRWYRAAHDDDAFFSARSDQNALSIILFQSNFDELISMDRLPHTEQEITSDSLFWLDREGVLFP